MASPENSSREKSIFPTNKHIASIINGFLFVSGALFSLSLFLSFFYLLNNPSSKYLQIPVRNYKIKPPLITAINMSHDPPDLTFYDDPNFLNFSIENSIKNWDEKRHEWLHLHPSFASTASNRILIVTGSQPLDCKGEIGDHLLLRLFKNKVDYCRMHGCDIFYNNLLLHPKMTSFWAKYPIIKAAMLAHPETEWIWWVDSDAVFTNMDFRVPLEKYKDYNLVVQSWPTGPKNSWLKINAGVFLIRNCQWSMEFLDAWVNMGPTSPDFKNWGLIHNSTFKDLGYPESNDQSALVYLAWYEQEKWGDKIYYEQDYDLQYYWLGVVNDIENITRGYLEIEKKISSLKRRHAEKVSEKYGELKEDYIKNKVIKGNYNRRRPLITHFTGCEPCSGEPNPMYSKEDCVDGMRKALNFADNQVLQNYGFQRQDLLDFSSVSPLQV